MDELAEWTRRMPRWFVLALGLALAALAVQGLFGGVVESPSSHSFLRAQVARAEQPGLYWALVLTYLVAGAALLAAAWRRFRQPDDEIYEAPPPAPPRPAWARALAWTGILVATALIAAGGMFWLDPLIGLLPGLLFIGGGLVVGLACVGYLVTGRLQ